MVGAGLELARRKKCRAGRGLADHDGARAVGDLAENRARNGGFGDAQALPKQAHFGRVGRFNAGAGHGGRGNGICHKPRSERERADRHANRDEVCNIGDVAEGLVAGDAAGAERRGCSPKSAASVDSSIGELK